MKLLREVLRFFFAALLLATGVAKLLDMPGFYKIVANYQMLPAMLIPASAWALALAELLLVVWLVTGYRLRFAALLVILLHAMYFSWVTLALVRGLKLDSCGCFGVYFPRPLTWFSPVEDLVLAALGYALWVVSPRQSVKAA